MSDLASNACEACRVGAPRVSESEENDLLVQLESWQIDDVDGIRQLNKTFEFENFVDALVFTNKVGQLAEQEGHHPAIITEWGKVTVYWWTHKIGGLHKNDFIMAAKTDAL